MCKRCSKTITFTHYKPDYIDCRTEACEQQITATHYTIITPAPVLWTVQTFACGSVCIHSHLQSSSKCPRTRSTSVGHWQYHGIFCRVSIHFILVSAHGDAVAATHYKPSLLTSCGPHRPLKADTKRHLMRLARFQQLNLLRQSLLL